MGVRSPSASLLGELAQHHVALQRREVIDEQHAVQMVDLVLQAGGEQPVGLDLPLHALSW